jgi:hypothetical protein
MGLQTVNCAADAIAPTPPVMQDACGNYHYPSCWCGTVSTDVRRRHGLSRLRIPIVLPTPMYGPIPIRSIFLISRCLPMVRSTSTVRYATLQHQPVMAGCVRLTTITPVAGVAPSPLTCEGDMVYTSRTTDCAGNTHVWTYTYTIDIPDFTLPADGRSTVNCARRMQLLQHHR